MPEGQTKGMVLAGVVAIIFHQISHEARPSRMVSRRIGVSPVVLGNKRTDSGESPYMAILTSARLESIRSDMTGGRMRQSCRHGYRTRE